MQTVARITAHCGPCALSPALAFFGGVGVCRESAGPLCFPVVKTYTEKLKDPRWQKMRLEVLEEAAFSCDQCGDEATELHVHHGYYRKGANPWDYERSTLRCLCKVCHKAEEERRAKLARILGEFCGDDVDFLIGFVTGLAGTRGCDISVDLDTRMQRAGKVFWSSADRMGDALNIANGFTYLEEA